MSLNQLTTRLATAMEQATSIDRAADRLQAAVSKAAAPGLVRSGLSGTWLGHPVHPFLVSMPIGCWTGASLLDALGQRQGAQVLVGAGVLSVVPTALTGLSDWVDTAGAERRTGFVHLAVNTAATGCYGLSWLARRRGRHGRGVAWAAVGGVLASGGGWLGGHLAYALGVGVDTNAFEIGPREWTRLAGTVPGEDGLARAVTAATPLLVATTAGKVRVLGDRCSHRGAPLSDGEAGDGCVTCPWHGSRFDLTDGSVRRGPAVVPQPVYEVRDVDGAVEVRRDEVRALRSNSTRGETRSR